MERGKRLDAPVEASVLTLVSQARDGELAICAGAGVSLSAGLPSGRTLAKKLHEHLRSRLTGYSCGDPEDLLAVAKAAEEASEGGREAVQRRVLELVPFSTATPHLAHRLLALLVAEGATRLLLTNWDTCVERADARERIEAARTGGEAEGLTGQYILKIHGCCTQPQSLLITHNQLADDAPWWAKAQFGVELTRATMVFVGIGSIADYAQTRIKQLAAHVEHARVRVVDPGLTDWDASPWHDLLPSLPSDRRLAMTAECFLDQLAREWTRWLVDQVRASANVVTEPAIEHTLSAFAEFTSDQAIAWLRGASHGWVIGESVVQSSAAHAALLALAVLARDGTQRGEAQGQSDADQLREVSFVPQSATRVGEDELEVLLHRTVSRTTDIEALAVERARRVSTERGTRSKITVLSAGGTAVGGRQEWLQTADVIDPSLPDDALIGATGTPAIRMLYADRVLEAA